MPASAPWPRLICLGEICEIIARKNAAFDDTAAGIAKSFTADEARILVLEKTTEDLAMRKSIVASDFNGYFVAAPAGVAVAGDGGATQ
jgi:hypothetical protein